MMIGNPTRHITPPKRMVAKGSAGAANTTMPTEQTANRLLQVTKAHNPHALSGKGGAGKANTIPPTEQSANRLLNVTKANNSKWKMSGKGTFGKVNPKSPDRTVNNTYIIRNSK